MNLKTEVTTGCGCMVAAILLNLGFLAACVWVIVLVMKWTGVL